MQRYPFTRALAATVCLLILSVLLLLSACDSSPSPNAQPNSTPQSTKGGYTIFPLVEQQIQLFLAPPGR
ncbi:MAG: hypothetical protein H0U76_26430 [Ktedonobacteraceae bacterium]|nr:hypothetical protein [Ktedonobacteraceae bacterium]